MIINMYIIFISNMYHLILVKFIVNYHLLKKVALPEPPRRGPLFSPALTVVAPRAPVSLDALHNVE